MEASHSSLVAWSDHAKFMQKGVKALMDSGKFSDLEIRCQDRVFKVHKILLSLFTDFFDQYDNLWVIMDCNSVYLQHVLNFIYLGETTIDYDDMEGFLKTCKTLRIPLFQVEKNRNEEPKDDNRLEEGVAQFQERFELNDFKLLCRKCYKCLPDEKKMKTHVYYCQRDYIFKCNLCDKAFNMKFSLTTHMLSHSDARTFPCTFQGCDKAFKYKSEMRLHQRKVHESLSYKCDQCDKPAYKTKQSLDDHVNRIHAKACPFPCTECPSRFTKAYHLAAHVRHVHRVKIQKKKKENDIVLID